MPCCPTQNVFSGVKAINHSLLSHGLGKVGDLHTKIQTRQGPTDFQVSVPRGSPSTLRRQARPHAHSGALPTARVTFRDGFGAGAQRARQMGLEARAPAPRLRLTFGPGCQKRVQGLPYKDPAPLRGGRPVPAPTQLTAEVGSEPSAHGLSGQRRATTDHRQQQAKQKL